ncbi:MAG: ABC transporter ATP-binding protein [Christensenellales bacterium]|jgi:putative ABC transport system ATP-binding protein
MIELKNITKIYGKGDKLIRALNNVSFRVNDNEFLSIMGKSGAGKSTLLHLLACMDKPDEGTIIIDNEDLGKLKDSRLAEIRNKKIGIVLQEYGLINNFSIRDNIMLPCMIAKSKDKVDIEEIIKKLDVNEAIDKPVKKLSGGQKQRIAIARALINNPDIILADEPTGSLDEETEEEIMKIFFRLNKEGKTIILITHDKDIAAQTHRTILLKKGEIVNP